MLHLTFRNAPIDQKILLLFIKCYLVFLIQAKSGGCMILWDYIIMLRDYDLFGCVENTLYVKPILVIMGKYTTCNCCLAKKTIKMAETGAAILFIVEK